MRLQTLIVADLSWIDLTSTGYDAMCRLTSNVAILQDLFFLMSRGIVAWNLGPIKTGE